MCKKCLSSDKISVHLYSDKFLVGDDKQILINKVFLHTGGEAPAHCAFGCNALVDVSFLGDEISCAYMLAGGKHEEFFSLTKPIYALRSGCWDVTCPYLLEHEVYDWNLKQ